MIRLQRASLALSLTLLFALLIGCASTDALDEPERMSQADEERTYKYSPEMMYVGYGYLPDTLVTGAISKVTEFEMQAQKAGSALELLEGRVAGVRVIRRNGGIAVRVRGPNTMLGGRDPLYVVDGMPIQPGPGGYLGINPRDVASIEVLKDAASTAMYGIRGANGVVVITTK